MSKEKNFDSWREEFYPRSVYEVFSDLLNGKKYELNLSREEKERRLRNVDFQIRATQHSITKWEGVRIKNLNKHNCEFDGKVYTKRSLHNALAPTLYFNGDSCSLCRLTSTLDRLQQTADSDQNACANCPIVEATGGTCHPEYGDMAGRKSHPALASTQYSYEEKPEIKNEAYSRAVNDMLALLRKTRKYLVDKREQLKREEQL